MKRFSIQAQPLFSLSGISALWSTLVFFVGATFSFPAIADADLARVSEAEVARQCSEDTLISTGKYAEFNRKQCRWAQAPIRTLATQKGDTCTCEALLNAAFELGMPGAIADLEKKHKCDGGNFAIFADWANTPNQPLTGRVLGGMYGALANKKLTKGDTAINELVEAVSAGHVAVVGLDAKRIYSEFALRHQIKDPSPLRASHALLVRAVFKDQSGRPAYFVVIDSSGPHRRYIVSYRVLVDAYGALLTRLTRGVYISNAKRA